MKVLFNLKRITNQGSEEKYSILFIKKCKHHVAEWTRTEFANSSNQSKSTLVSKLWKLLHNYIPKTSNQLKRANNRSKPEHASVASSLRPSILYQNLYYVKLKWTCWVSQLHAGWSAQFHNKYCKGFNIMHNNKSWQCSL